MARLSNPRVFILPAFRFERDGTILSEVQMQRPTPTDVFSCDVKLLAAPPFDLLGGYEQSQFSEVTLSPTDAPVVLLTGWVQDIPLFWHLDLLTRKKAQCDDATFSAYWNLRKTDELSHLVFSKGSIFSSFMRVSAQGRLLNLALYFFCFETEVGDPKIFQRAVRSLAAQEIVGRHWEELTSIVHLELGGGRVSFCDDMSARFKGVADVLGVLATLTNEGSR